jgi:hypothetical protein
MYYDSFSLKKTILVRKVEEEMSLKRGTSRELPPVPAWRASNVICAGADAQTQRGAF